MCRSVVFCVFQLIQVLSAYSADLGAIDMEDCTPLHYAAATGNANCCKFLAQRGAVRKSKNIRRPDVITVNYIFLGFQRWLCGNYSKFIRVTVAELRQALLFISFCCFKLETLENMFKNLKKKKKIEEKPREHAAANTAQNEFRKFYLVFIFSLKLGFMFQVVTPN